MNSHDSWEIDSPVLIKKTMLSSYISPTTTFSHSLTCDLSKFTICAHIDNHITTNQNTSINIRQILVDKTKYYKVLAVKNNTQYSKLWYRRNNPQ